MNRTWPCLVATMAACSISPVEAGDITMELSFTDDSVDVGDELEWTVTLTNHSTTEVVIVRPLDGSFAGMREPYWSLELLDEGGEIVDHALGFGPEGRCGMTNPLQPEDKHRLKPSKSLTLAGKDLEWVPPQRVLESA
ncbi:MAG: hypothetical protein HN348_00980, partial [Proteobacteria bacterium]|nr:hypothetical protein [Pseudomonadota bacterium]